jgi:hypothetical protein
MGWKTFRNAWKRCKNWKEAQNPKEALSVVSSKQTLLRSRCVHALQLMEIHVSTLFSPRFMLLLCSVNPTKLPQRKVQLLVNLEQQLLTSRLRWENPGFNSLPAQLSFPQIASKCAKTSRKLMKLPMAGTGQRGTKQRHMSCLAQSYLVLQYVVYSALSCPLPSFHSANTAVSKKLVFSPTPFQRDRFGVDPLTQRKKTCLIKAKWCSYRWMCADLCQRVVANSDPLSH